MAIEMKTRTRRGVALVEMAIVLPLLLLLAFGVMEYGWMLYRASQINNTARNSARYAVSPDVTTTEDIVAHARQLLTNDGIPADDAAISVPTGPMPGTGNVVTVEVSVPYSAIGLTGVPFVPTPQRLRSSVSMAKEGY